jgi:thiamine biosynthesis lipoprotein ApbE
MITFDFEKLGTKWWVQVELHNSSFEHETEPLIIFLADQFEKTYSRFDSKSKLYKLNNEKTLEHPTSEFLEMLKFAQVLKQQSYGYFDIRVATLLEKYGYGQSPNKVSQEGHLLDSKKLLFNKNLVKLGSNTKIDFGSFGKGWLIDNLFEKLNSLYKVKSLMINAGGDIRFFSEQEKLFKLQNPLNSDQIIGEIRFSEGSLGASAPSFRKWKNEEGKHFHHLLNPIEAKSQDNFAGVFVFSKEAKVADALATALFVSPQELHQNLTSAFDVSCLLIYPDGNYYLDPKFPVKMY